LGAFRSKVVRVQTWEGREPLAGGFQVACVYHPDVAQFGLLCPTRRRARRRLPSSIASVGHCLNISESVSSRYWVPTTRASMLGMLPCRACPTGSLRKKKQTVGFGLFPIPTFPENFHATGPMQLQQSAGPGPGGFGPTHPGWRARARDLVYSSFSTSVRLILPSVMWDVEWFKLSKLLKRRLALRLAWTLEWCFSGLPSSCSPGLQPWLQHDVQPKTVNATHSLQQPDSESEAASTS
jgi:hypothetical protein